MPAKDSNSKSRQIKGQNRSLIKAALETAKGSKANYLFCYADAFDIDLLPETLPKGMQLVFVTKRTHLNWERKPAVKGVVKVPQLKLGRMGMMKVALVLALSAKIVNTDDTVVFLAGKAENQKLDILMTICLDHESELITGIEFNNLPSSVKPAVFEHALNLAIELATKGREGKPVGTVFVLGDEKKVLALSKQMIINPFKGYKEDERNLLNPSLKETLFEFSALDGAFVIAGDGEVVTAGRYLGAATDESEIPRGLGARHIAAGGITALTNALAIVISESSGDVRIFRNGKLMMSIEKPSR